MLTDSETAAVERCLFLNEQFAALGLYTHERREVALGQNSSWLIAPEPFTIDESLYEKILALGPKLLEFYKVCNQLYLRSVRGSAPSWVSDYLDRGKPETVIDYGRMRRFRSALPFIIRPDIILTEDGFVITELDSVPGGMGMLGAMSYYYSDLGFDLVGGRDGMVQGFMDGVKSVASHEDPVLAVVVSEESESYRNEMEWLTDALSAKGMRAVTMAPEELDFTEDGLFARTDGERVRISVLYRFFELFDLKNIPKIDLILYAIRKELVKATPPLKSYLEEKMLFALFHHPVLEPYWVAELGSDTYQELRGIFPKTWILDPTPLPPVGVIPGLKIGGRSVNSWEMLKDCTQKERELVIKPSGFSELAWGSHGVSIGHDLSAETWAEVIDNALRSFRTNPYILQEFHKGAQVKTRFYDFDTKKIRHMSGRVRLCPYYFVHGEEVRLGGMLSTVCPLNKKIIHGMTDAVMAPTMVKKG